MTSPAAPAIQIPNLRVPYITSWSVERISGDVLFKPHAEVAGLRLTYPDPVSTDWMFGVLWVRQALAPQLGRPEWNAVHALRQRRVMLRKLCQVCNQTAVDEETDRIWWVLAEELSEFGTNAPPTCRACIPDALVSCPRLRRSAAVYTVGDYEPSAVLANLYRPGPLGPVLKQESVEVPLDAFLDLEWALATQLIVTLHDVRQEEIPDLDPVQRPGAQRS
ncbi:hypothetical protein ACFMQL_20220 [Nonomuraea fastidiosa]|uniref:hypothetical protein n=1 Tax=Nonomuraea fastidiosa TaxID=46173 RepID=UPI00366B03BE